MPSIAIHPSVCLSVRELISGTAGPIFANFSAQIPGGRGCVLLRRRCAMLCTSGFMDDVTFGRNGRESRKGWQPRVPAINYVRDRTESDVYECLFKNDLCRYLYVLHNHVHVTVYHSNVVSLLRFRFLEQLCKPTFATAGYECCLLMLKY